MTQPELGAHTFPARNYQDEAMRWRLKNLPSLGALGDPQLWRLENLPPLSLCDEESANVVGKTAPESGRISSHLTGLKLYTVVFGLSVSYFLILLNSTVVVTVGENPTLSVSRSRPFNCDNLGHSTDH